MEVEPRHENEPGLLDVCDDLKLPDASKEKDAKGLVDERLERMLADLQKEEWYHGCLPFEDIVGLIKKDGDFLLRELEPEGDRLAMACVTVKWDKVRDYPVHCMNQGNDRIYTIDGTNKNKDVMELVRYHHTTGTPVGEDVKLQNPVPKQRWELSIDKITMVSKIGAGAFGEVWQGTMVSSMGKPPIDVAIKVTKVNDENKAKVDEMHKEARLMRQYKHRNIVSFYGIVLKGTDCVMIVMELIHGGGLDHHIKTNPNIDNKEKIGYAIDVAIGLVYLHSKGCMHRDVACRNCLIDLKKNVVKLSDFGLSKQAEVYHIGTNEKLPIRWQAPEVIETRIYTMKCDVYSYAIFLWEIFNNAQKPYPGIDNKTIKENISNPKFRPVVDPKLPIVIQRVMKTCWRADPKRRPKMQQAARYLIYAPPELLEPGSLPRAARSVPVRGKASGTLLTTARSRVRTDRELAKSINKTAIQHPNSKFKSDKEAPRSGDKASLRHENVGKVKRIRSAGSRQSLKPKN